MDPASRSGSTDGDSYSATTDRAGTSGVRADGGRDPNGSQSPASSSPSAPASSPSQSSSPFWNHVSRVLGRFGDLRPFALVPLCLSLAELGKLGRAMGPTNGFTISAKFVLPEPLLELWSFVDAPGPGMGGASSALDSATGAAGSSAPAVTPTETPPASTPAGGGSYGGTETGIDVPIDTPFETIVLSPDSIGGATLGTIGVLLVVYTVLASMVAAVYIGGLDRRLRDEPIAVAASLVRYTPRFILYHAALFGLVLLAVPFALISPLLLVLAIPVVLVLAYLFYAAPFLFVVADARFLDALRRSYEFATDGGAYLRFALWHAGIGIAVSLVLSVLVSAIPVLGVVVALAVTVPLSLVLTAATVSFCRELVDSEAIGASTVGTQPGNGRGRPSDAPDYTTGTDDAI
ncbi:hypothetical protein [Natrialba asiatica]|uniref:Uncharacterized protein n=1 Tax=Natrialba asiatica (strain ATCC 700177 / DSM 12278 / JCM 9576 / FERM P-10747 / NBRC 102637 / 172P1) TaxID=29540 RepID=M0AHR9_NATA1|nr:hypothetical protein [Natrialba asiatica]ELY98084.1 hypothetical protein C481_19150 [Natrialba asiatica DSM 12278]